MPLPKTPLPSPPIAGPGSRARDLSVTVSTSGRALGGMPRGSSRMVAYDNWLHVWYVEKPLPLWHKSSQARSSNCAHRQTAPACRASMAPADAAAPRAHVRVRNGAATDGREGQAHPPPRLSVRVAWETGHAGAVVDCLANHGRQMLVLWRAILMPSHGRCHIAL